MPPTAFRLLGPLLIHDEAGPREVAASRQRALLAALLLQANKPVTAADLADQVWNENPPAGATGTLHSYLSRLRSALGPAGERIRTRVSGYVVEVEPGELDLEVFETTRLLAREAVRRADFDQAADHYAETMGLWRGAPFADIPEGPWREDAVRFWNEQYLLTLEEQLSVELRLERWSAAIPRLRSLVREHPFRERLAAQLLKALAADGRKAEALSEYRRIRRTMIEEAGVEPGDALRSVVERILRADPAPEATARIPAQRSTASAGGASQSSSEGRAAEPPAPPPVERPENSGRPLQLPPQVSDFTGRDAEIAALTTIIAPRGTGRPPAVAVVSGPGGVGKTSLAVELGHRLRAGFPDGQLFVFLGGLRAPRKPRDVAAEMLRSLGVAADEIPDDDAERSARLRSALADRRILIVLDDASDSAQVRPLLPGGAPAAVLVTSRQRLPGLAGQTPVDLASLTEREAREMLARIIGAERTRAEPDAVAQLVGACGGLPIALRICGSRLAVRRTRTVASLAARLREADLPLDELVAEDVAVRGCLDESYRALVAHSAGPGDHPDVARAFRLLSLAGGERFSVGAAAALLGLPGSAAEDALDHLLEVSLLDAPAPDGFAYHPLLRELAREHTEQTDSPTDRRAAVRRWTLWCLTTATAADKCVDPRRPRGTWEAWVPEPAALPFATADQALAWFDRESAGLTEAVQVAADIGDHAVAAALPLALMSWFRNRGRLEELEDALLTAISSAGRLGEPMVEGMLTNNLAIVHGGVGRHERAIETFERAIPLFIAAGKPERVAQIRINTAITVAQLDRPEEAAARLESALAELDRLEAELGPTPLVVSLRPTALLSLAESLTESGRLEEARAVYPRLLALAEADGSRSVLAIAWHNLGKVEHRSGRPRESAVCFERALALHREAGNLDGEGYSLWGLGELRRSTGDAAGAREAWTAALRIFEVLGQDAKTGVLRVRLGELGGEATGLEG